MIRKLFPYIIWYALSWKSHKDVRKLHHALFKNAFSRYLCILYDYRHDLKLIWIQIFFWSHRRNDVLMGSLWRQKRIASYSVAYPANWTATKQQTEKCTSFQVTAKVQSEGYPNKMVTIVLYVLECQWNVSVFINLLSIRFVLVFIAHPPTRSFQTCYISSFFLILASVVWLENEWVRVQLPLPLPLLPFKYMCRT